MFTLISTLNLRSEKRSTVLFCALKRDAGPEQLQLARTLVEKSQKAVAPREANLDSWRELANSSLFLFQGSSEKETRGLYLLKLDNHRISLDRKSGQAISDHETSTKSHTPNFHCQKTVDRSILRVKKLDSLRTVSTGEDPLKKRGAAMLFSRPESDV